LPDGLLGLAMNTTSDRRSVLNWTLIDWSSDGPEDFSLDVDVAVAATHRSAQSHGEGSMSSMSTRTSASSVKSPNFSSGPGHT
jgi:hypothetical protein